MFTQWWTFSGCCWLAYAKEKTPYMLVAIFSLSCLPFVFLQLYVAYRALNDRECRIFGLVWPVLLILDTLLGISRLITYSPDHITPWRTLVSDAGDFVLAWFLCSVLRGMESDVRLSARGETWARRLAYLIGGVLAVSSVLRVLDGILYPPRQNPYRPYRTPLGWSCDMFAYTYLVLVCGIFVIAIKLRGRYDPSSKREYSVPFWTLVATLAIFVRVMLVLYPLERYLFRLGYNRFYNTWVRLVDWVICTPCFIGIFTASRMIGRARDDSGMIPDSLQGLGRQGGVHLS